MNPRSLYFVGCRGCEEPGCAGGVLCRTGKPHHDLVPAGTRRELGEEVRRQADAVCAFRPHRLVPYRRRGG